MLNDKMMEKVEFATKAVAYYRAHRIQEGEKIIEFFDELKEYIRDVVSLWVGETNIGVPKTAPVEQVFQSFYTELMALLLMLKNNTNSLTDAEKTFTEALLYRGKVYRYLGRKDIKIRKPIMPMYNSVYVSWSKRKELTSYAKSKYRGVKTLLSAEILEDYGIDLDYFDLVQQKTENEVVYPTNKKAILSIEFVD
ncbi:MAG: hypothetical protein K6G36_03720 [Candidatus Saccharibacteria bacterium]|nr:hypothetical protein [Candidatus Saccharibacteria bacterium]